MGPGSRLERAQRLQLSNLQQDIPGNMAGAPGGAGEHGCRPRGAPSSGCLLTSRPLTSRGSQA